MSHWRLSSRCIMACIHTMCAGRAGFNLVRHFLAVGDRCKCVRGLSDLPQKLYATLTFWSLLLARCVAQASNFVIWLICCFQIIHTLSQNSLLAVYLYLYFFFLLNFISSQGDELILFTPQNSIGTDDTEKPSSAHIEPLCSQTVRLDAKNWLLHNCSLQWFLWFFCWKIFRGL